MVLEVALGLGALAAGIYGADKAASGQEATNAQNMRIARKQMQFNRREATKNRRFQRKMSNTQYERAMRDMRRSGLNPILAYKQGGAGTPSGAQATGAGIAAQNPDASYADLGNKAAQAAQTYLAAKAQKAQIANLEANTQQATASAKSLKAQEELYGEKKNTERANQALAASNTALNTLKQETEVQNTLIAKEIWAKAMSEANIADAKIMAARKDEIIAEIQYRLYSSPLGKAIVLGKELNAGKLIDMVTKGSKKK